jgi:hypothetical protein
MKKTFCSTLIVFFTFFSLCFANVPSPAAFDLKNSLKSGFGFISGAVYKVTDKAYQALNPFVEIIQNMQNHNHADINDTLYGRRKDELVVMEDYIPEWGTFVTAFAVTLFFFYTLLKEPSAKI